MELHVNREDICMVTIVTDGFYELLTRDDGNQSMIVKLIAKIGTTE